LSDEDRTDETADGNAPEVTVTPDFAHFGVVLERRPRKVFIPTLPEKYFVELRAPDAKGAAEIDAAAYEFQSDGVRFDDEGNPAGPERFIGGIDAWGQFLAKCYAQVVDFNLPNVDADGREAGFVTYKRANEGRNSHNRNVYESLSPALMNYLIGAMDWAAGESSDAREAFEALFRQSPSLVAD
jgi:hypothetical protein